MEKIYFEKQDGMMCAQHCLNNLLQDHLFTADVLAKIAQELDEAEGQLGPSSKSNVSENYDDSGYFSIQVIQKALQPFNVSLIPFISPDVSTIQNNPTLANGYICHFQNHWFTIRKFGGVQFINLDSTLKAPKVLSDTYLELLLNESKNKGYTIFIVNGQLPNKEADVHIAQNPLPLTIESKEKKEEKKEHIWGTGQRLDGTSSAQLSECTSIASGVDPNEDPELAAAILLSKQEAANLNPSNSEDDPELAAAIALSKQNSDPREELRQRRDQFLARFDKNS